MRRRTMLSLPRRIPTNTPLQALVTLNDPVYHEAAAGVGQAHDERGVAAAGAALDRRARIVTARDSCSREIRRLLNCDALRSFTHAS